MASYRVARRAFLGSCGASVLLWPLLRNIEANARGAAAPLRFLVIHHPLGTILGQWRPADAATTRTFTLPLISAPFEPLRSKMAMIDGLNIVSATRFAGQPTGDRTHEAGMVALMTGQPTLGKIGQQDHAAGGRSIDQILLDESPVLGGKASTVKTAFPALHLAADIRSDRDETSPRVLSYLEPAALPAGLKTSGAEFEATIGAARRPNFPETQPINVYERLFGISPSTAGVAQQQRVLDFIRGDLGRMRGLVPASELPKLEVYGSALSQLESSLKGIASCARPAAPPTIQMRGMAAAGSRLSGADYYDPADTNNHPHEVIGRAHLGMIKAAFLCDVTRVATFMWSAGTNWVVFPAMFNGASNLQKSAQPHHPISHDTNPATTAWLAQIDRWYAQQTAAFLQELDSTPDFDGNSLLDNTVVVYVTEVARAWDHDWRNVPFLVFGGKNTRIQGGQFIKVTDGSLAKVEGTLGGSGPNRSTNDVWLALAPIFGVNLTSLGDPKQYQGPLPGLVA